MTKLDWRKASQPSLDPARVHATDHILAPDEVVEKTTDLTTSEKRRVANFEEKRASARAALKTAENKRRRKRRAARNAVFNEDAQREARLRNDSQSRKSVQHSEDKSPSR